jgi:Protein of unknown function (DUF3047)
VQKRFQSAISITTGRLTTAVVNIFFAALGVTSADAAELSSFNQAIGATPPAPWHFVGLPDRFSKPRTQFEITELDGKKVLKVSTDKAYGNLVHPWSAPATTVKFSWRLDKALVKANLKTKTTEDIALKVCLSFDLPIQQIPLGERTKFKLAQLFSKETLPTATLCYVWAHTESVGLQQASPYTGRVHYIVLNSGENQLKTWQEHQRNISADFLKAYGSESNTVPAVTAIIVGADSDNTQDTSLGYVADIVVQP